MDTVLEFLHEYQYLAMFGILFLCGLGLPIPEEVTLVGSGLLVGWGDADFLWASVACVAGILAGDSIIFGLGYWMGPRFLDLKPMRFVNKEKVASFFQKHGKKTVFFARFVAGVRIGVYAFAGVQRMSWGRFLFLDFLGAMLSGPTSIWVGQWAAKKFASDPKEAQEKAQAFVQEAGHWVLLGIAVLLVLFLLYKLVWKRPRMETVSIEAKEPVPSPDDLPAEPPQDSESPGSRE